MCVNIKIILHSSLLFALALHTGCGDRIEEATDEEETQRDRKSGNKYHLSAALNIECIHKYFFQHLQLHAVVTSSIKSFPQYKFLFSNILLYSKGK